MKRTLLPLILLCAACEETSPEPQQGAPAESMWASLGNDAIADIKAAMLSGELEGSLSVEQQGTDASAVRLEGVNPSAISVMMHSKYGRCGGYTFHNSAKEAFAAVDDVQARLATDLVATSYTIDNATVANDLISRVRADKIVETISWMSSFVNRYYTTATGESSARQLAQRWEALAANRPDAEVSLFTHSWKQPSVIMTITGKTTPDEYVIVGGHLDSTAGWSPGANTKAPGADDDASGIATLTETMRAVLESGYEPARTLVFIGYAAEEAGLRGSKDIATKYKQDGKKVVGVLQLDMTNYPDASSQITLTKDYTNVAQNEFVAQLLDVYVHETWGWITCGYACSDHASWTAQGYAASFPFEALEYNPKIHTKDDTLETSDETGEHALKFAKVAAAFVAELAKGSLPQSPGEEPTEPQPQPEPQPTEPTTQNFSATLERGKEASFGPFAVPAGATLTAETSGSGDADLYVRWDASPTNSAYDCRPYEEDATESCALPATAARQAYVRVYGYSKTTFSLTVSY